MPVVNAQQILTLAKDPTNSADKMQIKLVGNSMLPLLENGVEIEVSLQTLQPGNKLAIGEIVTVNLENQFVTHRIVKHTSTGIITKGDALFSLDKEVSFDQVLGILTVVQASKYWRPQQIPYWLNFTVAKLSLAQAELLSSTLIMPAKKLIHVLVRAMLFGAFALCRLFL